MNKGLFRNELAQFIPYVPGKSIEEVEKEYGLSEVEKLASNENPLGPSPKAMEAVHKAVDDINLYPDSTAVRLIKDLAKDIRVKEENLVVGNGAEELLMLIAQTFINDGDEVIVATPSFGIYNTTTGLMGAKVISVPYKNKGYDFDGFLNAITNKTKLIYICNPNNPTGDIVTESELNNFVKRIPDDIVLILDEAYYEYAIVNEKYPDSRIYLEERSNTVILRTFSKVCGIAGVRIGYLITTEQIVKEMNKVKLTFDVNSLAQEAARGAIKDKEHIKRTVELNYLSLNLMEEFFKKKGLDYFQSNANFIFVNVEKNSKTIFEKLMEQGIIIRPGYHWGWDNWIRVSTGTEAQTYKFIKHLGEILEKYEDGKD